MIPESSAVCTMDTEDMNGNIHCSVVGSNDVMRKAHFMFVCYNLIMSQVEYFLMAIGYCSKDSR